MRIRIQTVIVFPKCCANVSLAARLNGYMYSNGSSLNLALFHSDGQPFIVCRITLQLLGVKIIPCRVVSLIDIQLIQKDWGQSMQMYAGDQNQIGAIIVIHLLI